MDLEKLRHSCAHVLASAVKELYPKIKLGIGPTIENGFYYDFDLSGIKITEDDFPRIEAKMKEIISKSLDFRPVKLSPEKIKEFLKKEPYKKELYEDFKKESKNITFFGHGDFIDLCKGNHVSNTKEIKVFKLLKTAGAYWKGISSNPMLTRIYATAFPAEKELKDYLKNLEQAESRDHRLLGKQLDLFSFHEESPGSVFFHPKGAIIYNELLGFIRSEYKKRNYQEVITPLIYSKSLWETSGHWKLFKENMFLLNMDDKEASLKPMNCPSHVLIYKSSIKSYRDLPLRIADFAPLHRNELRGVLSGLFRARKFQQDDAHIFCSEEQLESEINSVLDFINYIYKKVFDFDYEVELSTKPSKSLGSAELWNKAESILKKVLVKNKLVYKVNPGQGAFYGPKIDFHIKDALGRKWQLSTVQLDFAMPSNFEITYEGSDGKKHTPIMIHRALLGSLERFIGILLENYAGKLPVWLSPVQVILLTINDKNLKFAREIKKKLEENEVRVELNDKQETISRKVRDAQLMKIPYIITIGDKESESKTLAVRTLDGKVKFNLKVENFIEELKEKIKSRK
ncbi:threonine--tRNA ligase [Candidatus Woesearchaeota archaeon]|nr:threonine--tRNA ligase [Candidatus Woesearchaeota archaeon]